MIEISNLNIEFNHRFILKDVSIRLNQKSITLITGESGSGKTTLLSYISLNRYQQDMIYEINSKRIDQTKIKAYQKSLFSYVFQDYELFSDLSIQQNIEMVYAFNHKQIDHNRIAHFIQLVHLDQIDPKTLVKKLSGGQRQRVAIAMSLAKDTPFILMDEPTASLDEKNAKVICDIVDHLKDEGKGIIIVTHNPSLFHGDVIYKIENCRLESSIQNNPIDTIIEKKKGNQLVEGRLLFQSNRYYYIFISILLGICIGLSGILRLQGNMNYAPYEKVLSYLDPDELAVYNTLGVGHGFTTYFQTSKSLTDNQLNRLADIDNVEVVYPYYLGDGGGFETELSQEGYEHYPFHSSNNDQIMIKDKNGNETVIPFSDYFHFDPTSDETTNFYIPISSINEEMLKDQIVQYQEDIDEGIYISTELAKNLHIDQIEGLTLQIPSYFTGTAELDGTTVIGDISASSLFPQSVYEVIEYPIKGIIDVIPPYQADYFELYSSENVTDAEGLFILKDEVYLDYHVMKKHNEKAKSFLKEYFAYINLYCSPQVKYDENYNTPICIIHLKDATRAEETIKQIKKISPLLNVSGYATYYANTIGIMQHESNLQFITALFIGIIISILFSLSEVILYLKQKKDYAYLKVNGLSMHSIYCIKLSIELCISMFITIMMLIGYIMIKKEDLQVLFDYRLGLLFIFIYILTFVLNMIIEALLNRNTSFIHLTRKDG